MKTGKIVFIVLLLTCLSACTKFFFYPQKQLIRTPADVNIKYEDVTFYASDDIKLHGWFLPADKTAWGTVLFFHGNAENISTHLGAVYWMPAEGLNVFIFDYRGYGNSEGNAEIQGLHLDGAAALKYLRTRKDINQNKLIIYGQSLGGSIAAYTAATQNKQGIQTVLLESAFSDYRKIFREKASATIIGWPFQWPLSLTVENAYSPLNHIQDVHPLPLLFIHGEEDYIVPPHHSQLLYESALEPKQLWEIPKAKHTETFHRFAKTYRPKLLEYLRSQLYP